MFDGSATEVLTLIVLVVAGIGLAADRLLSRRKRDNPGNNHRKLHSNPSDPDKVFLGDVTVGWWERKMDRYTEQIVNAIQSLKK